MTEEQEVVESETVSESVDYDTDQNQEAEVTEDQQESLDQEMVPVSALQAQRRRRQEAEQKNKMYEDYISRLEGKGEEPAQEEDPDDLVSLGQFRQEQNQTKRELREDLWADSNPDKVAQIETYWEELIKQRPLLHGVAKDSPNRLAAAYQLIQDYNHLLGISPTKVGKKPAEIDMNARKLQQNTQKPGSPVGMAKTANMSRVEFLKSVQGTPQFREVREKMRRGEI